VTEGSIQVWKTLPEKIRQDPSLASFRQEHERLHGESSTFNFIFGLKTYLPPIDDVVDTFVLLMAPVRQTVCTWQPVKLSSPRPTIFHISEAKFIAKKISMREKKFPAHYVSFHS
jgi:hypothetical protein